MHTLENTPALSSPLVGPDGTPEMPPPILFPSSILLPWVWARHLYEPTCELSDFGYCFSAPTAVYIEMLLEGNRPLEICLSSPSYEAHCRYIMASSPTTNHTAEERLATILSNQYKCQMYRNRPLWYQGHPLDTAPKCFTPWRRADIPLIRDWVTCHRVVAKKAAWMGKVFSHKYYKTNGPIWAWNDPANALLIGLLTSDIMETIEFAISSDPFQAPHVVVTHSPGEEPKYLDTHGNPDQLTDTPSAVVPNLWGCTPRQSFTGPTGMDQLLLPPRMAMCYERDEYADLCAAATINRQNIFHRVSIQFNEGLRRARARRQRERGRDTDPKTISGSHNNISGARSEKTDFEPANRIKANACGFSDTDAAASLMSRGIMFQPQADDLALMAESAIISEESGDEDDDDGSISMSPHSPTIESETYQVLRRLGMIHCTAECDGESEASVGEDDDDIEDESEDESTGDMTSAITPFVTHRHPWTPNSGSSSSSGSVDLTSSIYNETDEQSSVSSYLVDDDSLESGSETPDTDEDDC
ncbi:unnamed protein product [Rhizoctonia solani]|uniref:Uncharacterized protein n=1 Tax=Rhizoctonia solani TaxID=456999 RepID=A0A8H2XH29_9AGAM|nr:unnamed protein product [Rhizoctonia solani]